jgi:hypothetical protein
MQFIFYFAYMNLQISFAFLMTTYFSSVRTATGTLLSMCALHPFYQIDNVEYRVYVVLYRTTDYVASLHAVTGYLYIFVSGLLSQFMFRPYVEDSNISSMYKVPLAIS